MPRPKAALHNDGYRPLYGSRPQRARAAAGRCSRDLVSSAHRDAPVGVDGRCVAFVEYAQIAAALGAQCRVSFRVRPCSPRAAARSGWVAVDVVVMTAVITLGALAVGSGQPGPAILRDATAALFPISYIGLPLGALAAVRVTGGRGAILLLMVAIVVSDSAQYYTGRAIGRRPLAPTISPKKTLEGAIGGLVFGTAAFVIGARIVFPGCPLALAGLVGASVAALGSVGDLSSRC